ncbi:PQQ-dependent sugar dehydrogenase [Pedobacter sp. ASV28]|uniref:PQQ-dependent sugar dehydrogenase n=1 Tax=Pedobacter sp. ASV28 TaxID=2795123 RepID=UPI0018EA3541|nr:PQQ-dependent sugar dehydrogenase [Pedobacter sp. ASV28]
MKHHFLLNWKPLRLFLTLAIAVASGLLMSHCNISTSPTDSTEKELKSETIVTGLNMPWAMAFLPDGRVLVTERGGKLRLVKGGQLDPQEITGIPKVYYRGQGGLLDVVLHPNYKENGWIYMSYSSPKKDGETGDDNGANTALMRAKLEGHTLTNIEHLYKASPNVKAGVHFGGRILFDKKGYVFLSLGERGQKENAQNLGKAQGKIVRLHEDGRIPTDNPFVKTKDALPEIWSYGHRNPQGLVMHPTTGVIWEHEHGPQGGDELNVIEKGKNYGWPLITYGIDYDNSIISDKTEAPGMEQPVIHWTPSIAPCGMTFVDSPKFKDWNGDLLVGSLKFMNLEHLTVKGNKVVKKEVIFDKIGRVRDIKQGPDGNIYVVVESTGSIVKISPKA